MDEKTTREVLDVLQIAMYILPVVLGAAILFLTKHFPTRKEFKNCALSKDLDDLGSRVNAMETIAIGARDAADEAKDRIAVMEERAEQRWERMMGTLSEVSATMKEVSNDQKRISENQAAMARDLKYLHKHTGN